ncbi:hypothetical protein BHE74_00025397 [Ensete ventricosum]|nr:hypothetical protein BHE74_00025397 [Ensete ventricosum]
MERLLSVPPLRLCQKRAFEAIMADGDELLEIQERKRTTQTASVFVPAPLPSPSMVPGASSLDIFSFTHTPNY